MPNAHEKSFNYEKRRFGQIFGQPLSIYSVDYSAQDQTPTLLHTKKKYKVEVAGPRFAQTPLPNASYYCIHGEYDTVNPGNVILPLRTDSSTPRITVLSKSPFEEIVGFRTSKLGAIYNGQTLVYDNVYFEFCTTNNYPNKPNHPRVFASEEIPTNQIVMYLRDLRTTSMDTEGLLIVEYANPNVTWKIQQVTDVGNMMELTVVLSTIE